jgi:hypothetical protein
LVGLAQHSDVNIVADGIAVGLFTHLGSPSADLQSTSLSMLSRKFLATRISARKWPLSSKAWGPRLLQRRWVWVPQRPLHELVARPNLRLGLPQIMLPFEPKLRGHSRQSSQTIRDTDNSVSRTLALLTVPLAPETPKTPDTGIVGVVENDQ